ncbi:hypothetical protein X777_00447 [Ooceraea biroi]|uniref:Secreted protein n=1 Tax=Ooceraea biroi TaxID=2015173 RepID=A0A026WTS3_OOCBI|nr:hypothetical protein X777_00447 [Ooceraea biroi]
MSRHAKRLIGMLLLRPRCINCAATALEYTMHFDPVTRQQIAFESIKLMPTTYLVRSRESST